MDERTQDDLIMQNLYARIDLIPLSRPKKDLKRDFSDGVLAAEIVKHFMPTLVEIHNYTPALSSSKKIANWNTLNRKVLSKLGCPLSDAAINSIVTSQPGAAENFLIILFQHIDGINGNPGFQVNPDYYSNPALMVMNDRPEADQDINGYYGQPPVQLLKQQQQIYQQQYEQQHQQQWLKGGTVGVTKFSPSQQRNVQTTRKMADIKSTASVPTNQYATSSVNHYQGPPTGHTQSPGGYRGRGLQAPPTSLPSTNELTERDETIELLQNKIKRLEHLVQLKDIRIEDLQTRLSNLEHASSHSNSYCGRDKNSKLPVPRGGAK